ncbi:MAG: hypothetical protein HFE59_03800 [Clostridiales bacterium]|nr:hypothetical protein [Clostridiales bacterium]
MIYSVNFIDMTEKLNPLAVSKYLDEMGWTQFPYKREDIKIYQFEKDNIFEQITVPLEKSLRDYKKAMYNVVEKIATVEEKSVEQVMLYLLNPNTDILKIRLDKVGVEAGSIMFDDAIQLYDNAKKLLAATALDIINPKKIHYGRIDESVQKFLNQCRFGQTEIGSYVVSIVCPFAELSEVEGYRQLSIFSDEERCANSLTRQVTNRLMTNIVTIKQKIDNNEIDSLVNNDNVISSNFYEALNGLDLHSENTVVEFMAEWSPTVKINRCGFNKVRFTNDYYQPIVSVIEKIRECANQSTEIVGRIKQLKASPVIDNRSRGVVTVVYVSDDNKVKSVSVNLNREDYENAIEAHQHGKAVKILGNLDGKRNASMNNVIFSVID